MAVIAGFLLMISLTVVANLLMKLGTEVAPAPALLGLWSWKTVAGFATFGASGLVYAWLLKFLPLNVAQSFAAAQFISVILASAVVLSEPIPATRWVGIVLIVSGILLVGFTLDHGSVARSDARIGPANQVAGNVADSSKATGR